jgi:hypothetical protein
MAMRALLFCVFSIVLILADICDASVNYNRKPSEYSDEEIKTFAVSKAISAVRKVLLRSYAEAQVSKFMVFAIDAFKNPEDQVALEKIGTDPLYNKMMETAFLGRRTQLPNGIGWGNMAIILRLADQLIENVYTKTRNVDKPAHVNPTAAASLLQDQTDSLVDGTATVSDEPGSTAIKNPPARKTSLLYKTAKTSDVEDDSN